MAASSSIPHPPAADALAKIAEIAGAKGVVADEDSAPFLAERRGRWPGSASMIVAPSSTRQVADIMKVCAASKIAVTPQGGNTGLVGGQIPYGGEILLSLKRLNEIRNVSPLDNTMTVDAGVTLAAAQEAASDVERLFPLSIGSEGVCQIGGVISTNAGGVNVLRYGNMRELVLGLEVVTPHGEIWDGLKRLRKNNTGYDLKQLFIGGEGTLGLVTGAVLKLFPQPKDTVTIFASAPSAEAAVALLSLAQEKTGGLASSFELISHPSVELVLKNIPNTRNPLQTPAPWYVLAAFSSGGGSGLRGQVETLLEDAIGRTLIEDAVIAENEAQAKALWHVRHSISESMRPEGPGVKCDISVPTARIPEFLKRADRAVLEQAPGARVIAFGHVGDGNIHYDVVPPVGANEDGLNKQREAIEERVYEIIGALDGSISAEHGVGRHKREAMAARKSETELTMLRAVKSALDPDGIMNPGKML